VNGAGGTTIVILARSIHYPALAECRRVRSSIVSEFTPDVTPRPRLLDRVCEAIRAHHYSRRTEKTYVAWIKRYIFFHGKRHPVEMGAAEVTAFLTSLAVDAKVAASTQNQALSALLFLYRAVLGLEVPWLDDVVRARRPERNPSAVRIPQQILSRADEVIQQAALMKLATIRLASNFPLQRTARSRCSRPAAERDRYAHRRPASSQRLKPESGRGLS
jgi:hypothetical protein